MLYFGLSLLWTIINWSKLYQGADTDWPYRKPFHRFGTACSAPRGTSDACPRTFAARTTLSRGCNETASSKCQISSFSRDDPLASASARHPPSLNSSQRRSQLTTSRLFSSAIRKFFRNRRREIKAGSYNDNSCENFCFFKHSDWLENIECPNKALRLSLVSSIYTAASMQIFCITCTCLYLV